MMPTLRAGRPSLLSAAVDLLLAMLVALVLAVTARGAAPQTGLASSGNFTVWADSQPLAEDLLERAEAWRRRIATEWLGGSLPDGLGQATLNVRVSGRQQAHAWLADGSSGSAHLVWIQTTPDKLEHALAHEIAHLVLAARYPEMPAFAQEGIAGRYDDDERIALRRRTLDSFVHSGRWPRLDNLLAARGIPPSDRASYTAAVSLTEFLLSDEFRRRVTAESLGNELIPRPDGAVPDAAAAFLAFVEHGGHSGRWDEAVARAYGLGGVEGLERAWRAWAADALRPRANLSPPGSSRTGSARGSGTRSPR